MKKIAILVAGLLASGCYGPLEQLVNQEDLWRKSDWRSFKAESRETPRVIEKQDKKVYLKKIDECINVYSYGDAEEWMQAYFSFYGKDDDFLKRVVLVGNVYLKIREDETRYFNFRKRAESWGISLSDEFYKKMLAENTKTKKYQPIRHLSTTQPPIQPATQPSKR